MKPDQERVKALLTDTVTLLCKNGLHYSKEMKVQGLLGITLDENDVFVVHINEKFGDLIGAKVTAHADEDESSSYTKDDPSDRSLKSPSADDRPRARKRRSSQDSPVSPSSSKLQKDTQSQPRTPQSVDSDSARVPSLPSPSHSGSAPGTPIKIKKEEDVICLDEGDQLSSCIGDRPLSGRDDRNAMQQTYSNISLSDIQSGIAHLEQVPAVDIPASLDSVTDSPSKVGPGSIKGFQPPFVTGIVKNQGDGNSGSAWDSSTMGTDTSQQGTSAWDTPQMPAQSGDKPNCSVERSPYTPLSARFMCKHCHQRFSSTGGIYSHVRKVHGVIGDIHFGEHCMSVKKLVCPVPECGVSFRYDSGLCNHTKRVHGKTPSQLNEFYRSKQHLGFQH